MGNANPSAKRILVVEDELHIAELCRRTLGEEGFKVDIAYDGEEAQGKIAESQHGLLFMDIRLPKMNGLELYEWLQVNHPHLANRVAFMTGSVMGSEALAFLEQSGRPYLLKPFGRDELKAYIREALGRVAH